ncbi:MAG: hypothetical protein CDV28_10763 [Candidatus Electronema aureum]|uniref:Tetratricopeptide repeat-containing protein n=1 Tax=Candidatus Electronema aureum TaxID=2005002 RepID=A0A521G2Z6_9BACT|nr:MAG: hypothetical protein CDV28_10763 [Candidatus Electronema aureum]
MNKSIVNWNHSFVFFLIACIVFVTYSNTFNASWQLDDEPNITNNSKIHVTTLNFHQINNTFRANPIVNDKLYRPLPCLTFGLNWYVGQGNVFGYHIVNLAIHILTTWFLFLSLHLLLHIHYQKKYPAQFFFTAALFGTLFWALAPIQTQAVTYIVQRMASMAAMFTIIAIYAYLRGRTERKYAWFILCLLSFFAALASKENAILLPLSLVLIEFAFFPHRITKKQLFRLIFSSLIILIAGFLFVRYGLGLVPFKLSNPLSFLDSYANRSFSFSERILTQPRIVLMYLSQIFLPVVEQFSIEHDIVMSSSLFFPWTTLPAMLTILLSILAAIFFLKKYPLICFPVLFFFLNHVVESTILQLELIFEHRNYLPSFFLFLPIGVLIARILYSNPKQSAFRQVTAALCSIFFLIVFGQATYTRNLAWATEYTLWADAIRKAPNSSRAAHHLGKWHYYSKNYNHAIYYFQLALRSTDKAPTPKYSKYLVLNALGLSYAALGKHNQAILYLNQCLELGDYAECLQNRSVVYADKKMYKQALTDATQLANSVTDYIYQLNVAIVAFEAGNYATSYGYLKKIINFSLENHQVMHLAGLLLMKEGAYPNSLFFLKQANKLAPDEISYQLTLAAAYHVDHQPALTETVLNDIFKKYSLPVITNALKEFRRQNSFVINAVSFIERRIDSMIKTNAINHEQQPPAP